MVKSNSKGDRVYKAFVYVVLIAVAISIIVPVAWVFMASIKENSEFYQNPWALPAGFYWQNFVDAWQKASMGSYMLNSVIVTALAPGDTDNCGSAGGLLPVALQVQEQPVPERVLHGGAFHQRQLHSRPHLPDAPRR